MNKRYATREHSESILFREQIRTLNLCTASESGGKPDAVQTLTRLR